MPTPGIDDQLQYCKRFHLRVRRYTLFRHVPSELATHQVLLRQWWDCLQNFYRLVAYGFAVGSDRRRHRQLGEDLKQVILDHVADGAGLIIKGAPALNPEVFRHRDLHALHVVAVLKRLPERVRESEVKHVMDGRLAR